MSYGGNVVTHLGTKLSKSHIFCDDLYTYEFLVLKNNEIYKSEKLKSFRVFLLEGKVRVNDVELFLPEDSVQAENVTAEIKNEASESRVLLVGTKLSNAVSAEQIFFAVNSLKRVEKPWGYEVWITGEHPLYCLKKIFIKKGTRTSLQYHNQKRETNVLFEGTARLYFKKEDAVNIDDVQTADLGYCDLDRMSVIDVFPRTLHRLEALTDILLFEASTPQLDDVIRISDDSQRGNGRIQSEHGKK